MRLTTKQDEPVVITLEENGFGEIQVLANKLAILTIETDGTILLNVGNASRLDELGFQIDENDKVVVE